MIHFEAKVPVEPERPAAPEPVIRLAGDRNYRCEAMGPGTVVHDGRVHAWDGGPESWSGSFLAWAPSAKTGSPGLTVYTDRLGTVPLYLAVGARRVLLATTLAAFGREGFRDPDSVGVQQVLLLGSPHGARTLLDGVGLLPPASEVQVEAVTGVVTVQRYWTPPAPRVEGGNAQPDGAAVDRFVQLLRQAHERIPPANTPVFPVTDGLDSRCNLALAGGGLREGFLVHCAEQRDAETPIARRVARVLGRDFQRVDPARAMRGVVDADPFAETGELASWQWWLAGVGEWAEGVGDEPMLVDGYLQDVLFNPHAIRPPVPAGPLAGLLDRARFHWRFLTGDRTGALPVGLEESLEEAVAEVPGDGGLATVQNFYLANRSRRFVFGTVRLAQNRIRVALPGLDRELMDHGLDLPWQWRAGGGLYRKAIERLSPELARIPEGKSGLALTSRRQRSLRRRAMRYWERVKDQYGYRFLPGSLGAGSVFSRLLARDPAFRTRVQEVVGGSEWLAQATGRSDGVSALMGRRVLSTPEEDLVCNALTVARLERVLAGETAPPPLVGGGQAPAHAAG